MAQISVQAFLDGIGTQIPASGQLKAIASAARVSGDEVLLPAPVTVRIVDGAPVEPIILAPTGAWFWSLTLSIVGSARSITRTVAVPDVVSVEWADLVDVDPATFEPVVLAPSAQQVLDQALAAANNTVVGGEVVDGDLLLTRAGGTVVNAGPVVGPQGLPGADGAQGLQGADGAPGPANVLSIGTVTGGASASATITGTAPEQKLNLVLPKGDTGAAPVLATTSTTSHPATMSPLNKTFALVTPTNFTVGQFVRCARALSNDRSTYVAGFITAISPTSMSIRTVEAFDSTFDGPYTSWEIVSAAPMGDAGPAGAAGSSQREMIFTFPGTLTTKVGVLSFITEARGITINECVLWANQTPTGASILVDVNVDGASIFTLPADRPIIDHTVAQPAGMATYPKQSALNKTYSSAARKRITVDIDQVGSTFAGADLTVALRYTVL